MLSNYTSYLKRRWRQVCGTLAVLLMFLVPATRAVIAGTSNSGGNQGNQGGNNGGNNNGGNNAAHHPNNGAHRNHHHHPGNSRNCSRPTRSTPRPVGPVEPSSGSRSGASRDFGNYSPSER